MVPIDLRGGRGMTTAGSFLTLHYWKFHLFDIIVKYILFLGVGSSYQALVMGGGGLRLKPAA